MKGQGSMYFQLQPFSRPDIKVLVGNRIDVLCSVDIDGVGEIDMRWCRGEVINVIENIHHPTVNVKWDPTSHIAGYEEGGITEQVLLLSKWNKDGKDGAWRRMWTSSLKVINISVTKKKTKRKKK